MNVWSFDEGKEKRSSGKCLSHEADSMVDKLVNPPLQQERFCYLLVSCEYSRFLPIELPVCSLGSNGVGVIVRIVAPSAASSSTSSSTSSSAASSADKAGSLEESTRRLFWFIWDGPASISKISFSTSCDVLCFGLCHLGLHLRGHNRGESRKGSVSD